MEISAIMHRIQDIRKEQESLGAEENLLWKQFFIIADDVAGEDKPYRYLDEEQEMVIARSVAAGTPRLNSDALLADPKLTSAERTAITKRIVVFDLERLERALRAKKISPAMIKKHTKTSASVERRLLQPATKEERAVIAEKRNDMTEYPAE